MPSVEIPPGLTKPAARPAFTDGDRVRITLAPYRAAREAIIARRGEQLAPPLPPEGVLRVMSIVVGLAPEGPVYLYRLAEAPGAHHKSFVTIPENHLERADAND